MKDHHHIRNELHRHSYDSIRNNIPLLTCAFLAALTTGGPIYAFGIYGSELKTSLGLTQSQLDTLSSASFCAGLLSWIPGLMVDYFGVKLSLIVGGFLGAVFMTLYWIIAKQIWFIIDSINTLLITLGVLGILIFMSNSLVTGSVFKLIVTTCASHTKGSIVGAAKGYVGLGSGVYACLFRALKTPQIHDLDFLLLAAILVVFAACLPAIFLLPSREELVKLLNNTPVLDIDQTTSTHLKCLYFGLIVLMSMVITTTLASLFGDDYDNVSHSKAEHPYNIDTEPIQQNPHIGKAISILVAWLGPILSLLVIPPKYKLLHESEEYSNELHDAVERIDESKGLLNHSAEKHEEEPQPALHDSHEVDECKSDDGFKPLVKTHSFPALAYGAEITDVEETIGPRGLLGKTAIVRLESRDSTSLSPQLSSSFQDDPTPFLDETKRHRHNPHHQNPNYNLIQMLQTLPAWLFCWITIIRVGSGTMVTNNMGQLVESLRLPKHTTTPAALALFSVSQAISRVMTGAVSDWALSWTWFRDEFYHDDVRFGDSANVMLQINGLPRSVFLIVASLPGTCAHLFMSLAVTRNWFILGVCFSGAAFGMIWPLMVLIVGEVFGIRNMGQNYMFFDGLSGALGTLLLSKYVTQEIYENHIDKDDLDGRTCYGKECFFGSHIIIAILSFTCALASYWFYRSTRYVYAIPKGT